MPFPPCLCACLPAHLRVRPPACLRACVLACVVKWCFLYMQTVSRTRPPNPIAAFADCLLGVTADTPGSNHSGGGGVAAYLTENLTRQVTEAMTEAMRQEPPPMDPIQFVADYLRENSA